MVDNEFQLRQIVLSGPLQEITFYQVNDSFFQFSEEEIWLIDVGVELKFPYGTVSAAWDSDIEIFCFKTDSVKNIYKQNNLFILENEAILKLQKYRGLKVVNVKFETLEFEYIADYTMRIEKEQRFVEMTLIFENNLQLQIAFVDFDLEENKAPKNFRYDISTEILISAKNTIAINK